MFLPQWKKCPNGEVNQCTCGNSPVVRTRTRTTVAAVGVALALVVGFMPAGKATVSVVDYRWASAITFDGPRLAVVGFNDIVAGVQPWAGESACVGLVDQARSLYAVGCTDTTFASIGGFSTAVARGSVSATVWRYPDLAAVGTTVLHYDVRWTAAAVPGPLSFAEVRGCAGIPWASAGAGVHLASTASVAGTVSSAELGTVRFEPAARAWYTALGELVAASASTGVPVAPLRDTVQCISRWTPLDLQRLTAPA